MFFLSPPENRPLTHAPRLPLRLGCVLHLPDGDRPAVATNISYSGIGVELPGEELDPRRIEAVTLDGIGRLETVFRWQRWGRAGLSFRNRSGARPLLNAYFRSTGEYPV